MLVLRHSINTKSMTQKEKQRFVQKRRINEETVGLCVFAARWFQCEEMHYTDAYRRDKCLDQLRKLLGGPAGSGVLQRRMNRMMDGILDRLRAEFPTLSQKEILVFSHAAAGLTNDLSARLLGLRCARSVSVIKSRLRERIRLSGSPNTLEYLILLPQKGCRFGEEMLYLHNLKQRKKWKL